MGRCSYCGDDAGLLRSRHRKCQDAYARGLDRLVDVTARAILHGNPAFTDLVNSIARRSYIDSDTLKERIVMGWSAAVDRCLEDSVISHDEELLLTGLAERYIQSDAHMTIQIWIGESTMGSWIVHFHEESGRRAPCGVYQNIGGNPRWGMTSDTSKVTCGTCKSSLRFMQALDADS